MKLQQINRPKESKNFKFIGFRYWKRHEWDNLPYILSEFDYLGLTFYKIDNKWFVEQENKTDIA